MPVDPLEKAEAIITPVYEAAIVNAGGESARRLAAIGAMIVQRVLPAVFQDPNLEHSWDEVSYFVTSVVETVSSWALGSSTAREELEALVGEPLDQFREIYRQMSEFEIDAGKMVEAIIYSTIALDDKQTVLSIKLGWTPEVGAGEIMEMVVGGAAGLLAEVDHRFSEEEHQKVINRMVSNLLRSLKLR